MSIYEYPYVRISVIILSLLGLGIASYLGYAYLTGTEVVCMSGIFHGCGEVQESAYAQFFGIPIPLYGVAFYIFLLVDGSLLQYLHRQWYAWRSFVWFSTFVGFVFTAYLTFLEAFVIEAWCIWCIGSAVVSTALFAVVSRAFFRPPLRR